ncbi:hypothetical protein KIPB_000476, partial [Kipferlia bialata]
STDTIKLVKMLAAKQLGTRWDRLRLQKWHNVYNDNLTLEQLEIQDGMSIEMHYM